MIAVSIASQTCSKCQRLHQPSILVKECRNNRIQKKKKKTYNIDNIKLPANVTKPNGVDEEVEGRASPREGLSEADTLGPEHKGEHLRNVNVGQGVHDGVEHVIDENHGHHGRGCVLVARLSVVGAHSGPHGEDGRHAAECNEVLGTPAYTFGEKRECHTGNEVPALWY